MTNNPDHRRSFSKPLVLAGVVALLALLVVAGEGQPAYASTFTVTKTADTNDGVCDADCSLREAIGAANALAAPTPSPCPPAPTP